MTQAQDGLTNFTTKLGTANLKSGNNTIAAPAIYGNTMEDAYRGSWVAQKIIDLPAEDTVAEWRDWQGDNGQIERLEQVEKELDIKGKVRKALQISRLTGGSAIFIGTGEEELDQPLTPKELQYITVLGRENLTVGEQELSIASPNFGNPKYYNVALDGGFQVKVHPSRLVIFKDGRTPLINKTTWGDGVLAACWDALMQFEALASNIAELTHEAKVDVFGIPDLMGQMERDEDALVTRITLASRLKGNTAMLVKDAAETYESKSQNFGSLAEIMDRFATNLCGASGIPRTRLFGVQTGGLQNDGSGDLRLYYDKIRTRQQLDLSPAMALLDECIKVTAKVPESVWYDWSPLWGLTNKDKADIAKTLIEAGKTAIESGLMPIDNASQVFSNALIEMGVLPGLEQIEITTTPDPIDETVTDEVPIFDINAGHDILKDALDA